jgi:hypothetical protein
VPHLSFSLWPFVTVAAANFLLGWTWYSPLLFAVPWMAALKMTPEHMNDPVARRKMPMLFGTALLNTALFSFFLQLAVKALGANNFFEGALDGLILFAFPLCTSLNSLWEGRSPAVIKIALGWFLFSYVVFGGVIGAWH